MIGCISAALRATYVLGTPEIIAYVGDMKVAPEFSGGRTALRLIRSLEAYLRSMDVDLCFSVAAEGNHRAFPLFEGRLGTPRWVPLGSFSVDEMLTAPWNVSKGKYSIGAAEISDAAAIFGLVDRFHRSRQFAPVMSERDISSMIAHQQESSSCKLLVARTRDKMVGVTGVYDAGAAKQTVLLNAPLAICAALAFFRKAILPFKKLKIPSIGDTVQLLYVSPMACDEEHWEAFPPLLRAARAEAFRQHFALLALGLHERDPLLRLLRGIPRFTFSSQGFLTSLNSPKRLEALRPGIPFEDFALV